MSQRLKHALHNEDACNYLAEKGVYSDWVITTAFYSAVHFVRYKIFPIALKHDGTRFSIDDFESYVAFIDPHRKSGKHRILQKLVDEHCLEVSGKYKWLKDTSWTARYNNYSHKTKIANKAQKLLLEIKEYCEVNN